MAAEDGPASDSLVQRLMTAEEVYVYKIPPLKSAGGHRAEDWNLAKPLQTCNLVVERRGDALWMDFLTKNGATVFAQSKLDLSQGDQKIASYFEQVTDSSRYFVLKIQGAGGKQAMIGFGFREREHAVDLREALQHYERAMDREANRGSLSGSYSIPTLQEGEKIHVNTTGTSVKKKKSSSSGGGAPGPLLKKPPPPADEAAPTPKKVVEKISIQMGDIDLDALTASKEEEDDDDSGEAVYEGDEEQWATEFDAK